MYSRPMCVFYSLKTRLNSEIFFFFRLLKKRQTVSHPVQSIGSKEIKGGGGGENSVMYYSAH